MITAANLTVLGILKRQVKSKEIKSSIVKTFFDVSLRVDLTSLDLT